MEEYVYVYFTYYLNFGPHTIFIYRHVSVLATFFSCSDHLKNVSIKVTMNVPSPKGGHLGFSLENLSFDLSIRIIDERSRRDEWLRYSSQIIFLLASERSSEYFRMIYQRRFLSGFSNHFEGPRKSTISISKIERSWIQYEIKMFEIFEQDLKNDLRKLRWHSCNETWEVIIYTVVHTRLHLYLHISKIPAARKNAKHEHDRKLRFNAVNLASYIFYTPRIKYS